MREGDTVIVHSMDHLARDLEDLRAVVRTLTAKGVQVQFRKESPVFTGEDSSMATSMLSVMGAFEEFECSLIRECQREGIALAKQRGAYRGRRRTLSTEHRAGRATGPACGGRDLEDHLGPGVRGQPGNGLSVLIQAHRCDRATGRICAIRDC